MIGAGAASRGRTELLPATVAEAPEAWSPLSRLRLQSLDWPRLIAGGLVLLVMGRFPVLFLRMRLDSALGHVRLPDWEFDGFVREIFAIAPLATVGLAVMRDRWRDLARHWFLLALLAWGWLSTVWSVEPGVTLWFASMFVVTSLVGWYIGSAFSLEEQAGLVAGV